MATSVSRRAKICAPYNDSPVFEYSVTTSIVGTTVQFCSLALLQDEESQWRQDEPSEKQRPLPYIVVL